MPAIVLTGKVKSGMNNFSYWMDKLSERYQRKTGMRLFPGTLNIELPEPYILPKTAMRFEKEEYGGTVSVSILPCEIFGRKAFILRTDKNASGAGDHPLNVIEVATDVKLRDAYALSDGDSVEVVIPECTPHGP